MTMIRWQKPEANPWAGLQTWNSLRDEINQLFDINAPFVGTYPRLMNAWGPALDLYEDKDSLVVKVELPGMSKEEIEVSLHDGTLTISGERKPQERAKETEVHRRERFFGHFQRSVALTTPVKADAIKAVYTDGILTVTLPKAEEAKPKQIAVDVK